MSNIIYPFQIPIYQSFIEEDSFTQIKKDIKLYIKKYKEEFKTSWDCPTLSTIDSSFQFKSDSFDKELKKITEVYFNEWGFEGSFNLKFSNVWVNISPKGSFQESHKHSNYFEKNIFSGVFYVDVTKDSGNLFLVNPIEDQLLFLLPTPKISPRVSIIPQNRKIICFPSWMEHYVGINKSHQDRISVSWNIEVINK